MAFAKRLLSNLQVPSPALAVTDAISPLPVSAELPGHQFAVTRVVPFANHARLATACSDGFVRIFDPATGAHLLTLAGDRKRITALAAVSDRVLLAGACDGCLRLWDGLSGVCLSRKEMGAPVSAIANVAEKRVVVAVASFVVSFVFWPNDEHANPLRENARFRASTIHALRDVAGFGEKCVTVAQAHARAWDVRDGRLLANLKGSKEDLSCVAMSDTCVLVASQDKTVRVYDSVKFTRIGVIRRSHSLFVSVMHVFRSQFLVSVSHDNTVCVVDIASGGVVESMNLPFCANDVSILLDGRIAAVGHDQGAGRAVVFGAPEHLAAIIEGASVLEDTRGRGSSSSVRKTASSIGGRVAWDAAVVTGRLLRYTAEAASKRMHSGEVTETRYSSEYIRPSLSRAETSLRGFGSGKWRQSEVRMQDMGLSTDSVAPEAFHCEDGPEVTEARTTAEFGRWVYEGSTGLINALFSNRHVRGLAEELCGETMSGCSSSVEVCSSSPSEAVSSVEQQAQHTLLGERPAHHTDEIVESTLEKFELLAPKWIARLQSLSIPAEEKARAVKIIEENWTGWKLEPKNVPFSRDDEGFPVVLGSGGYGSVYKGVLSHKDGDSDSTKVDVAIKVLTDDAVGEEMRYKFMREVLILRATSHPRIVKFYGASWPEKMACDEETECWKPKMSQRPFIVTELMTANLSEAAKNGFLRRPDQQLKVLQDVAEALAFLHEKRIVHQDVSPENVLVQIQGESVTSAKVTDFGISRVVRRIQSRSAATKAMAWVGRLKFRAPEAVLSNRPGGFEVDVWSFAALCTFVARGLTAVDRWSEFELGKAAEDGSLVRKSIEWAEGIACRELRDLCKLCFARDPSSRPCMSKVSSVVKSILTRPLQD